MKRILYILVLVPLILKPSGAFANTFCFASASTYYQQVYCELQVRGKSKGLPDFNQFKQNSEPVQYSLLKSLAETHHIELAPPQKSIAQLPVGEAKNPVGITKVQEPSKVESPRNSVEAKQQQASRLGPADCIKEGGIFQCGAHAYRILGNKSNQHLPEGALADSATMNLPIYAHNEPLNQFLSGAYARYIEKMCAIGLCGTTMSYTKFVYFYRDLEAKSISFSQRFETMYRFLKKDKMTLAVTEKVSVPSQLTEQSCDRLNNRYMVCDFQGQNYVFENAY